MTLAMADRRKHLLSPIHQALKPQGLTRSRPHYHSVFLQIKSQALPINHCPTSPKQDCLMPNRGSLVAAVGWPYWSGRKALRRKWSRYWRTKRKSMKEEEEEKENELDIKFHACHYFWKGSLDLCGTCQRVTSIPPKAICTSKEWGLFGMGWPSKVGQRT